MMNPSQRWRTPWHVDGLLLVYLLALLTLGLSILYSASHQNLGLVERQLVNIGIGLGLMFVLAQLPPRIYCRWAPWIFGVSLVLLVVVMLVGDVGKGAQRWLEMGFLRFQPSELVKIALPMAIASFLNQKILPPRAPEVGVILFAVALAVGIVMEQPDLGSAIMILSAGVAVLFFAGVSWKFFGLSAAAIGSLIPVLWMFMHDYQKKRIFTFIDPSSDPLGGGWNIIQSKIAIGSGGLFGKGWLNGTQAHLGFLPERSTDFIFAVCSEEFGLVGVATVLILYSLIIVRGFQIAVQAQDTFSRLFAGSFTFIFSLYVVINIGMVSGMFPVVGLPLPFLSYGGTSLVTLMGGFGVLMSIHSHRRLLST